MLRGLRALAMSLCFSQAPGGFFSLFSLDADCCLWNSNTVPTLPICPSLPKVTAVCCVKWLKGLGGRRLWPRTSLLTRPRRPCLFFPIPRGAGCTLNKELWVRACLGCRPSCDLNLCTQVVGIYTFDRHFHKQFFSFLTLMSSHIAFICITVNTCPDRKLQAGIFIYNRWRKAGAWWIGVWLLN